MAEALAGVIGRPVAHSLSPAIFERLSRATGIAVRYQAVDAGPEAFKETVASLSGQGWKGLNVTIPHKEAALALADERSAEAAAIGAANVLRFAGGRSFAYNTDAEGFLDALRDRGFDPAGRAAAVFGAGGAARAVCWALGKSGTAEVRIAARGRERAEKLAAELGAQFPGARFGVGLGGAADLWVNATPLGMLGRESESPVSGSEPGWGRGLAYDLVYRPAETAFMKAARAKGMAIVPGLDMLVHQALRTWELWFGPLADRGKLKEEICRSVS